MVNSTSTNPYVRHSNNKQNTSAPVKNHADKSVPQKNSSDALYILDLSGMKNKDEAKTYQDDESAAILDLTKSLFRSVNTSDAERTCPFSSSV